MMLPAKLCIQILFVACALQFSRHAPSRKATILPPASQLAGTCSKAPLPPGLTAGQKDIVWLPSHAWERYNRTLL
jgi:hypothetical protein